MSGDFELDEMKAIIDEFMVETDELVSQLDSDLVAIEKTPDDLDLLNRIFRSAHTIKGTSGFLGFNELSRLTHKMEDVLNKLRKGELKLSPEMMDTLLECVDYLKGMLAGIADNGQEVPRDLSDILAKLDDAEKGMIAEAGGDAESEPETEPEIDSAHTDSPEAEPSGSDCENSVEKLFEQIQEGISSPEPHDELEKSEQDPILEQPKEPAQAPEDKQPTGQQDKASKIRKDLLDRKKADTTIRVDVKRLDNLMNMMGELVLGRNSLVQLSSNVNQRWEGEPEVEKLNQATTQINFITTELQMAVMKMRMLPIGNVFNKFPRVVRDLARDQKKQIDLQIYGEETELDKSVIEEIGDPLVHLIRNSCDHGIEPPDERVKAGKQERGTITLIADQEGSHIVIKVKDDGRGLDVDRICEKAIEKGIATREEIRQMPEIEKMLFIFHPGFSTAKKITDVSGRGVGMDVVRTNIEKLNGTIEIESKKGEGTSIIIKLPLTLAIVQGLLVRNDEDVYAIPLASVLETVRLKEGDIQYINQREVIRLRDTVLPIINLTEVLDGSMNTNGAAKPYVVVVGLAEKRLGLLVDDLLGQEEVVIKSLGDYLGNTPGVAGATIMGDGRIRLIVDIAGLFNLVKTV